MAVLLLIIYTSKQWKCHWQFHKIQCEFSKALFCPANRSTAWIRYSQTVDHRDTATVKWLDFIYLFVFIVQSVFVSNHLNVFKNEFKCQNKWLNFDHQLCWLNRHTYQNTLADRDTHFLSTLAGCIHACLYKIYIFFFLLKQKSDGGDNPASL